MNKDILIQNISRTLKLLESEKEYAFRTLISKVADRISFNEALKIENIGVFQLKKEPLPRQERAGLLPSASKEKRTLIYSPPFENLEGDAKSMFLTLDLDDLNISSSDDLSKSFSLSVNQPLMPLSQTKSGEESEEPATDDNFDSDLERRIINLVEDGELLKDFDIWEEYLNRNPHYQDDNRDDIEADEEAIDDILKSETEFAKQDTDDSVSVDDFVYEDEEESETLPEENLSADSVEEMGDDAEDLGQTPVEEVDTDIAPGVQDEEEIEGEEEIKAVDEFAKTLLDDDLKAFEEIAELENTIVPGEESDDSEVAEETLRAEEDEGDEFDELTKGMLSKDSIDDILDDAATGLDKGSLTDDEEPVHEDGLSTLDNLTNIDEDIDEEDDDENKSVFDELEDYLKDEDSADDVAKEFEEESESEPEPEQEEEIKEPEEEELEEPEPIMPVSEGELTEPFYQKKWFLIAAPVLLVLIVAVIFLLPGEETTQAGNTADQTQSETNIQLPPPPPRDTPEQQPEQTGEEVTADNSQPVTEEPKQVADRTGMYRDVQNDDQVANQIFYDGQVYMVQVSSWRSSAIAEREVERLREMGHDAFIYQLYLESKGSTWNRVRIGYFNSQQEAQSFLDNNKL